MGSVWKPGRMPFYIDSEANSYTCQVKELAGEKHKCGLMNCTWPWMGKSTWKPVTVHCMISLVFHYYSLLKVLCSCLWASISQLQFGNALGESLPSFNCLSLSIPSSEPQHCFTVVTFHLLVVQILTLLSSHCTVNFPPSTTRYIRNFSIS